MRKERAESVWRLCVAALLLAVVFWRNLFRLDDPDVWFHLKTGELILKTGALPQFDAYTYTIEGRPWLAFEWLAQAALYAVYAASGAAGLIVFKAAVVAAGYGLFFALAGGGFWAAFLLGAAAWTSGGLAARPLLFDPLLLALLLRVIERAEEPPWAWLGFLQVLWVNLHGGAALLGAGAVGLKAFTRRTSWKWWAAAALSLAVLLLNPGGWEIFSHLHATLSFPGRELINDWKPLASFLNVHGAFFLLAAAAAALSWREEPLLCLLSAALGIATLSAVRNATLFEAAAAVLAARAFQRKMPAPCGWMPAAALAVLAGVLFAQPRALGTLERARGAVEFLDRAGVQGRMFNEYQLGGYLIWKTYPRRPVFMDGRGFEFGPELISDALHWQEPEVWAKLDERWHFDYAVLENSVDYRARTLDDGGGWVPVYWDDASLVYLRREPANEEIIRAHGYRYLRPNQADLRYLGPLLADPKTRAAVEGEIERAIAGSRFNRLALRMKAWTMAVGSPRAPRANHSP